MSIEFKINGVDYRAAKLDTFKQLHVSRKLAPILPKILPAIGEIAKFSALGEGEIKEKLMGDLGSLSDAFTPIAEALAGMPDEDCEYIFKTCLAVVKRSQGASWVSITAGGSGLMFDDIDLAAVTIITFQVISASLGPFIRGFLSKLPEGSPTTTQAA